MMRNRCANMPMSCPRPQMSMPQENMDSGRARIDRKKLLQYISEISFVLNDLTLYLDTHEGDEEALTTFFRLNQKRREALSDYSRWYGPLVLDDAVPADSWKWASQPMPWEGGAC